MAKPTLRIVLSLSLAALAAAPAVAQEWLGAEALGMEVKGDKEGPVAGVEVRLHYMLIDSQAGPAPLETDAKGHLVVAGLGRGIWRMELHKEGYADSILMVRVGFSRKAEVVGAPTRSADGVPLRVSFFRVKGAEAVPPPAAEPLPAEPAPVKPTPRPTPKPAPPPVPQPAPAKPTPPPVTQPAPPATPGPAKPAEKPPEKAPAPPPPTPPPTPKPTPMQPPAVKPATPAPPPPTPEPKAPELPPAPKPTPMEPPAAKPTPPPVPEPKAPAPPKPAPESVPEPPEAAPAPAPESVPEPPEAPPTPAPQRVPEPPEAAPTPAPESVPEAPEAPPTPAPAAASVPEPPEAPPAAGPTAEVTRSLRDPRAGECTDCKPGEAAVTIEQVVPPGGSLAGAGSPCDPGVAAAAGRAAAHLVGVTEAGSPLEAANHDAGAWLAPYAQAGSPCQVVAVVLPAGARYSSYRLGAADESGPGACWGTQECEIGACAWAGRPEVVEIGDSTLVYGVFRNASPDRARRARLTVYFKP